MKELLEKQIKLFKAGRISEKELLGFFDNLPYNNLGNIKLDFHRKFRRGLPEVIYGKDKNIDQLRDIVHKYKDLNEEILITRVVPEKYRDLHLQFPDLLYHPQARIITFNKKPEVKFKSPVLVLSAGSSDEPVAEEAYVTSIYLGNRVEKEYDVGVACIARILDLRDRLNEFAVIIVIAGMEGALPSVVAGLTSTPIIAVPTSIGYGANLDGLAALLAMLNSCSGGVSVVNIDNGFGAAFQATLINQKISQSIKYQKQ